MSQATVMEPRRRALGYMAQSGGWKLTPKQNKRLRKKQNRWIGCDCKR